MATGDKVYLADKQTLDNVDTNVDSINNKIGESTNTADTSGNTLFSILKGLGSSFSSARAQKLDGIGASTDSASATGTTLFALLKQVVTDAGRLTSTRAGYIDRLANSTYGLDKIQALVKTDNTASISGTLSQKLSSIIGSLADGTNGLAAIKTAVNGATLSSTRLGYIDRLANGTYGLDKIQGLVATSNTSSRTGTLSQKLTYIINNMGKNSPSFTVSYNSKSFSGSVGDPITITGNGEVVMRGYNNSATGSSVRVTNIDGVSISSENAQVMFLVQNISTDGITRVKFQSSITFCGFCNYNNGGTIYYTTFLYS